jgi:hypothetical protein
MKKDNYIASYFDKYNYSKKEYRDTLEQVTVSDNQSFNSDKLNNLKESIKFNAKSMKKYEVDNNTLYKTEKEKLLEFYQNMKNNSKLNISKEELGNMINSIEKKSKPSQTPESNEFVIYNCFKNMLKPKTKEEKVNPHVQVANFNNPQISPINKNQKDLNENFNKNEENVLNDSVNSMIKDLKNIEIKEKCKNSHCIYYRKKYKFFKKNYEKNKTKLKLEKKVTEMLNLKLFYESNKHMLNSSQTDRSEKFNSTTVTGGETKFKELSEKLEENIILFEKLESEILNKNTIIEKQNESIKHQKDTIDKLLTQIGLFLNNRIFEETTHRNLAEEDLRQSEDTQKDELKELTMSFSLSNNKSTNNFSDRKIQFLNADPEIQDILNNNLN